MGKKIFILDDEPEICELVSENLKHLGYEVSSAHRGSDGIRQISTHPFDLIILDIHLPDTEGTAVYEQLRRTALHQKTPVIFLTALAQGAQPILAGIHDARYSIMAKPTKLEDLHKEIVRLIG